MLLSVLIFFVILMLYLHIYYHLKVSSELEIYELDNLDKSKIEETCNLRQPVIFNTPNEKWGNVFSYKSIMNDFNIFDVKVRKWDQNNNDCDYIPLKMSLVNKLFSKKNTEYYSEKNVEFLEESGLIKHIINNDDLFKPYLKMSHNYDLIFGNPDSCTPLKYNVYNRNYFCVCDGSIKIKLIPPTFSKYLNIETDYENFEFRSPMNTWNIQKEYSENYGKSKVMELTLRKNDVIYIPSYWCYSIRFGDNAMVLNLGYSTAMSFVSTLHHHCLYFLQQQNIKHKTAKCVSNIEIEKICEDKEEEKEKEKDKNVKLKEKES